MKHVGINWQINLDFEDKEMYTETVAASNKIKIETQHWNAGAEESISLKL